MRRIVFSLIALSVCASCKLQKLAAVVGFEGEIEMSATGPIPITTTMKIKGAKMRTETASLGGFTTISDGEAKKMWMLNASTHTYTETDLSAKATAPSTKGKSTMKAVKTGRSDKVAGYACDVYEIVDPSTPSSSPIELCMASGIGMIALGLTGPFATFAQGNDAWSEVMANGFPLRMTMRDAGGKPLMSLEATRIERKSEPDSEFQVPAGYTKTASPI